MNDEFLHQKVIKSNLGFSKHDRVQEYMFLHSHPLLHGKIYFRYSWLKKLPLEVHWTLQISDKMYFFLTPTFFST